MSTIIGTSLLSDRERKLLLQDVQTGSLHSREQEGFVTDKQGRKRFHGAFTGGFSAGYFNTVGSAEGWKPSKFVSSRNGGRAQSVQDFMDEDDDPILGQKIQVRPEVYQTQTPTGTAAAIVAPVRKSVGRDILRRLGWQQGQGVGPRERAPLGGKVMANGKLDPHAAGFKFAPKDVSITPPKPKIGLHGLGYKLEALSFGNRSDGKSGTRVYDPSALTATSRLQLRNTDWDEEDVYGTEDVAKVSSAYDLYLEDLEEDGKSNTNNSNPRSHYMRADRILKDVSKPLALRYKQASQRKSIFIPQVTQDPIPVPTGFVSNPDLEDAPVAARKLSVAQRGMALGERPLAQPEPMNTQKQYEKVLAAIGGSGSLTTRFSKASHTSDETKAGQDEMVGKFEVKLEVSKSTNTWYPAPILCKRLDIRKPTPDKYQVSYPVENRLPKQFGANQQQNSSKLNLDALLNVQKIPEIVSAPDFNRPAVSLFDEVFNESDDELSDYSSSSDSEKVEPISIVKPPSVVAMGTLEPRGKHSLRFKAVAPALQHGNIHTSSLDSSIQRFESPESAPGPETAESASSRLVFSPVQASSAVASQQMASKRGQEAYSTGKAVVRAPATQVPAAVNPELPDWVTKALGQAQPPRQEELALARGQQNVERRKSSKHRRRRSRSRRSHRSRDRYRRRSQSRKSSKKKKKSDRKHHKSRR